MQIEHTPQILLIDDEYDEQRGLQNELAEHAEIQLKHPNEVVSIDLAEADLVLVDLRLEIWPQRDNLGTLTLQPKDGLALAAVLGSHIDHTVERTPTAFAIFSGHISDLSGGLPPNTREHALARVHNLEWVFQKANLSGQDVSLSKQFISLASAVHLLPKAWPRDDSEAMYETVMDLLSLPISDERSWLSRAWRDIEACYPPLYELSSATHGLAFLRWFLHRILPYPCFLWDIHYLSARLRVKPDSLKRALASETSLRELFEPFHYSGILSDFLGDRWWRSGVEAFIWDITDGNTFNIEELHSRLNQHAGGKLETVDYVQPVVCVDRDYKVLPQFFDVKEAVRIQPDDWPPYADDAWTTIELAKDDSVLRALVVTQDKDRLE